MAFNSVSVRRSTRGDKASWWRRKVARSRSRVDRDTGSSAPCAASGSSGAASEADALCSRLGRSRETLRDNH